MATIDPLHPVQSAILQLLAAKKGLSVKEVRDRLRKGFGITVSTQNLYRTVGQLIDNQVLVKKDGGLHLHLVWLSNLKDFLETASAVYLDEPLREISLPEKEGDVRTFSADSLRKLDPVWADVLVALANASDEKTWYIYNARPWYALGMRDTETRVFQGLVATGLKICMLHGNDTYLDRYGAGLLKVPGLTIAVTQNPPLPKDGYTAWFIDDFVLECVYPPAIVRQFNFFFDTVSSLDQFDIEQFADIFRLKCRCAITLRRSARIAEKGKEVLKKFFPEPKSKRKR